MPNIKAKGLSVNTAEIFNVYEHVRNDNGQAFYVGKGSPRRPSSVGQGTRNREWSAITDQLKKTDGFSVRILSDGICEELAYLAEMERIDQLKRRGIKLCNISIGGAGSPGVKRSAENIALHSARMKGHKWHVGKVQSKEWVDARTAGMRGNKYTLGLKHTDATKKLMAEAKEGVPQPLKTCPHCLKIGGNAMLRWHFDACKARKL